MQGEKERKPQTDKVQNKEQRKMKKTKLKKSAEKENC